MFNNVALDVCIGLIFVFLLYSLLATIIQEIIAQWLSLRQRMLLKAIRNMLEDRAADTNGAPQSNSVWSYLFSSITRWWTAAGQNWEHFKCPLTENSAAKAFYSHPAIKYLSESSWNSKPAYIAPSSFANTLILLLRGEDYDGLVPQMSRIKETLFDRGLIDANGTNYSFDEETLRYLQQLYRDAQGDADRFRALLEKWYNDTMDRVGGWYKRQTQFILFLIGLAIALIFNADTITITNILSKDKIARENLVNLAINHNGRQDPITRKVVTIKETRLAKEKTMTEAPADKNAAAATDSAAAAAALEKKGDAVPAPDTVVVKETTTMIDPQLEEAFDVTLSDINNAHRILGLGWDYKDTSTNVRTIIDSLGKSGFTKQQQAFIAEALLESSGNKKESKPRKFLQFHPLQRGGIFTIAGWFLTALAVSMGAPFWFDLLNKVIRLRATGAKPDNTTDTGANLTGPASSGQTAGTPAGTTTEQLKVTDRKG